MFNAKIWTDSYCTSYDNINFRQVKKVNRLTTVELTYPRCIHSEFMTHRMFSRNSASSRAIPYSKQVKKVMENPFIPLHWGKNQKGMQAFEQFEGAEKAALESLWLEARNEAVRIADKMNTIGLHKQIINRILEPFSWITIIATGNQTAFENFFALRCHPDAEPHIQKIAYILRDVYDASCPKELKFGEWHLPLIGFDGDEKLTTEEKVKVSTGRVARTSYETHDGKRDVQADIDLHDRLISSKHFSPTEHQAQVGHSKDKDDCYPHREEYLNNFGFPWVQYRKTIKGEVCHKAPR